MLSVWRRVGFRPLVSGSQRCFSIMLILAALGGLAGCGLPFGNTQSGPSADDILAHIQKLQIDDMTLTTFYDMASPERHLTISSTMKFTQNPKRVDEISIVAVSTKASGANVKGEIISDIPGGVFYAKTISPASAASQKWYKFAITESSFANSDIFAFVNLSSAHVVGKETLLSIPVWHIRGRGDFTGERATSTYDVYVRQDTYFPAETVITEPGDTSGKTFITYTAFNTGISIALPPDNQVVNS